MRQIDFKMLLIKHQLYTFVSLFWSSLASSSSIMIMPWTWFYYEFRVLSASMPYVLHRKISLFLWYISMILVERKNFLVYCLLCRLEWFNWWKITSYWIRCNMSSSFSLFKLLFLILTITFSAFVSPQFMIFYFFLIIL